MRTNPFNDTWAFLLGQTGPHQGLAWAGPLIVLLTWALLLGSVAVAVLNWRRDPAQRTATHVVTWLFRLAIGGMWLEGSVWKLPLPVSGGMQHWTEQLGVHAAFAFHRQLATDVLIPNLYLLNPLVYLTETTMAAALVLGLAVRLFGAVGIAFTVQLWLGLYHHPSEWPWLYVFLIITLGFFIMHAAGRSLGLDALIRRGSPPVDGRPLTGWRRLHCWVS